MELLESGCRIALFMRFPAIFRKIIPGYTILLF